MTKHGPETPRTPSLVRNFVTRTELQRAVHELMAEAQFQIVWWDQDLHNWPVNDVGVIDALGQFLRRPQTTHQSGPLLRLLVHDEHAVARHAVRLLNLQRRLPANMAFRLCSRPIESVLRQPFLMVDHRHLVTLQAARALRGQMLLDAETVAQSRSAEFEAAWEDASACLPATTLGL